MTNITEMQRALLASAASEQGGVIDAPRDGKVTRSLIKRGLAISLPIAGGGSRLIITEAGRASMAGVADAAGSADDPVGENAQTPGRDASADPASEADRTAETANGVTDATGESEAAAPGSSYERPALVPVSKLKKVTPSGKLGALVDLLKRPDGATVEDMVAATGWQVHSVRGAMSGSLKKGFGFTISSEKTETGRVYKIAPGEAV